MELQSLGSIRAWRNPVTSRRPAAELDSPLGRITVFRGPIGAYVPLGGSTERWEFVLDGSEILSVDGMGTPGYGARGQLKRGVDVSLLGVKGRVTGRRSLGPRGRFVRLEAGGTVFVAGARLPRDYVVDSSGTELADFNGTDWRFRAAEPGIVAFAALIVAADLGVTLMSPLLEIF
ncbi:hypothetical protein ACFC26_01955 [Kitasatospora purpeofusca]|uniref:hypothetical protein n=1 Tax=Kitasatospora purpeofusca TaxID=67352 RepID=UPI0004BEDB2F